MDSEQQLQSYLVRILGRESDLSPFRSTGTGFVNAHLPLNEFRVANDHSNTIRARISPQALERIRQGWSLFAGVSSHPGTDFLEAMIRHFVRHLVIEHVRSLQALRTQPLIYLANHQTAVESMLFIHLMSAYQEVPIVALAKSEHEQSWLGRCETWLRAYPGARLHPSMTYIHQQSATSMLDVMKHLQWLTREGYSLLIHVEGARQPTCRTPVRNMSSDLLEFLLSLNVPLVPVRFAGGLPIKGNGYSYYEFPYQFARQDYYVGAPLDANQIGGLPAYERKSSLLAAISSVGPDYTREFPNDPNCQLESEVIQWMNQTGVEFPYAVLFKTLSALPKAVLSPTCAHLLRMVTDERLRVPDSPQGEWLNEMVVPLLGTIGMYTPQ